MQIFHLSFFIFHFYLYISPLEKVLSFENKNKFGFILYFAHLFVPLHPKYQPIYFLMRKIILLLAMIATTFTASHAGGLMTNTNYHIAFDRMMARGASFDIDAAYSNPAGLAWGHEGFQLSINFQKPWQYRNIDYKNGNSGHLYEGVASAPIVPALFACYRKNRFAVSAMIGIVGSGGFVKYDDGVPMFNVVLAGMFAQKGIAPNTYQINSEMKGKQYIYGGQLNLTYKVTDFLSVAAGARANYYDGYYRGHVTAEQHPLLGTLANLQLDVDQRGWGYTPIISANYHKGPLTLAARYEFRTKINVPNKTNDLQAGLGPKVEALLQATDPASLTAIKTSLGQKTIAYQDGVETRYDMPALLSVAVGYEFEKNVRATLEYHYYDDKNAKMANNRQEHLTHGTHEFLAGIEGDVNDRWTLSCGVQRTDYGLSDDYQQNTSFACDSYSIGLGAAVKLTDKIRLNAGYFCSIYDDYQKTCQLAREGYTGTETYSRTNHVIGLGVDFKF